MALKLPLSALPAMNPHDVVLLPFSSGTTGRPSGVELTARAMYACGARVAALERDAAFMLAVLPFFHIAATMIFHVTIFKRITTIVLPRFEPGSFLRAVEKYRLDTVNVVPPIVQFLAKHPLVDKFDLSAINRLGSGAAPLGHELVQAIRSRFGVPVLQSYGMTELAGTATHSSETVFRDGAVGQLLPNTELRVRCLDTDVDLSHQELLQYVNINIHRIFDEDGTTTTLPAASGYTRSSWTYLRDVLSWTRHSKWTLDFTFNAEFRTEAERITAVQFVLALLMNHAHIILRPDFPREVTIIAHPEDHPVVAELHTEERSILQIHPTVTGRAQKLRVHNHGALITV
ncbi:hypothetical protein PF003_g37188 [Phytophthora fragariae]|nr:hypothetical protein PF003_g37188 [Phytophthora fragariae]